MIRVLVNRLAEVLSYVADTILVRHAFKKTRTIICNVFGDRQMREPPQFVLLNLPPFCGRNRRTLPYSRVMPYFRSRTFCLGLDSNF